MKIARGLAALAIAMALTACGDKTTATLTESHYDQLSQADWSEMTAAPTTATVTNNFLIMMR